MNTTSKTAGADGGFGAVSRRGFLCGGGVFAGALALSALGMGGCADGGQAVQEGPVPSASQDVAFEVYDTDILVIGGGTGASLAACQAAKEGHVVTMVDKGPFMYSGATGMNWDCGVGTGESVPSLESLNAPWMDGFADFGLTAKAIEFMGTNPDAWNLAYLFTRMGNTGNPRGADGALMNSGNEGTFLRHVAEYANGVANINVIDNTMITGIIVSEGACVGAVGLHVNTGAYRVFRANATVIANGGSTQMYGWSGTGAISINSPDNTGDADMAAYRHGCSLVNAEFFSYDLISTKPASIGGSFASGIGADSLGVDLICNKDGEFFLRDIAFEGYVPITTFVAQEIRNGGGNENGCVYIDMSVDDVDLESVERPAYMRNVRLWKEELGIDVMQPGNLVEVGIEPFEHMGTPVVDENMMTEIPGLFNVRGAGNTMMISTSHYLAPYAAHCACEYAAGREDVGDVDLSDAVAEISRLEGILNAEGSKRPFEIRHAIQNACYEALHIGPDAESLQKAIDELARIKSEDLPQMHVATKTRVWNNDWRQAIENVNILELAEASLKASLMREESRIFYYRADFPEQDDENWFAHILVKQVDGEMTLEKVPIVF